MIKIKNNWTSKIGIGIVIFISFYILSKAFVLIYLKIKERTKTQQSSKQLLFEFIANTTGTLIIFVGAFVALNYVGFDMSTILVVLASAGLGIALALKDFLTSCVNGIVILALDYFKKEDFVKIGDIKGFVHNFNLINTTIRDTDKILNVIPNNTIISGNFINYTKSGEIFITAEACISNANPKVNINKILDEFSEIMKKSEYNTNEKVSSGISSMDENGTVLNFSHLTKPENTGKATNALKKLLREYLTKANILMCNNGSNYFVQGSESKNIEDEIDEEEFEEEEFEEEEFEEEYS